MSQVCSDREAILAAVLGFLIGATLNGILIAAHRRDVACAREQCRATAEESGCVSGWR